MSYIATIIVTAFVLFMAYWWGSQGLFSSLLHLLAVIIAGALSFALWEVVALDVFMPFMPSFAWGVGLLLPFLLLLFVLRLAMDKLLPANMYFNQVANMAGGGVLGFLSGVLTAGIMLIGIEFLPMGASIFGYQPLYLDGTGKISEAGHVGQGLWFPVDKQTAGFFNYLSEGAFGDSTPLALYQPDVARQAATYRIHFDDFASLSAPPGSVVITHYNTEDTPLQHVEDAVISTLGDSARNKGHELVVVDTKWDKSPAGAYDNDTVIRVAPTQVILAIVPRDGAGPARLVEPIGLTQGLPGGLRIFQLIDDKLHFVHAHAQPLNVAWVYLIPSGYKPVWLMARHLRLELPPNSGAAEQLSEVIGNIAGAAPPPATNPANAVVGSNPPGVTGANPGTFIGPGSMILAAEITDLLPVPISKNIASSFTFQEKAVEVGDMMVHRPLERPEDAVMAYKVVQAKGTATIRLRLERTKAIGILGNARNLAQNLGGVWLTDSNGQNWLPFGYVIKKNNQDQLIHINVSTQIQSGREIPVNQVGSEDELYLYFSVDKGIRIASYHMGQEQQALSMPVP